MLGNADPVEEVARRGGGAVGQREHSHPPAAAAARTAATASGGELPDPEEPNIERRASLLRVQENLDARRCCSNPMLG